jgi:hypothetical protein
MEALIKFSVLPRMFGINWEESIGARLRSETANTGGECLFAVMKLKFGLAEVRCRGIAEDANRLLATRSRTAA